MRYCRIGVLCCWCWSAVLWAADDLDVQLVGILGKKVVLMVNGERHVMQASEVLAEGLRLERIGDGVVTVVIGGESRELPLGSRIGTSYQVPASYKASVFPDQHGMYFTLARINGLPVNMLVDTGASAVAFDDAMARRLGIEYRLQGRPQIVSTASGQVSAYMINLSSVAVGDIRLNNVEALVIEGQGPDVPLLGMSFLRRLKVSHDGAAMVLETR